MPGISIYYLHASIAIEFNLDSVDWLLYVSIIQLINGELLDLKHKYGIDDRAKRTSIEKALKDCCNIDVDEYRNEYEKRLQHKIDNIEKGVPYYEQMLRDYGKLIVDYQEKIF